VAIGSSVVLNDRFGLSCGMPHVNEAGLKKQDRRLKAETQLKHWLRYRRSEWSLVVEKFHTVFCQPLLNFDNVRSVASFHDVKHMNS
jgi:hypothetical protein